jgi:PIN domain nuclease of toxin-antitoxin system
MASLLLDTCAAIWLMSGSPLAPPARRAIRDAVNSEDGCFVSPFTAWEIATLAARRRIDLTMTPDAWFDALLALPGFRLAELSPSVLISSAFLPGTLRDPADRIIVATARAHGFTVVTRDRPILDFAQSGDVSALKC